MRPQGDSKADLGFSMDHVDRILREIDTSRSTTVHDGSHWGPPLGPLGGGLDVVQLALSHALVHASAAGQWTIVAALVDELAARRG